MNKSNWLNILDLTTTNSLIYTDWLEEHGYCDEAYYLRTNGGNGANESGWADDYESHDGFALGYGRIHYEFGYGYDDGYGCGNGYGDSLYGNGYWLDTGCGTGYGNIYGNGAGNGFIN